MRKPLFAHALLAVLVCAIFTGAGYGQDPSGASPRFVTLPPHSYYPVKPANPAVQLPQWTLQWTSSYNNRAYSTVMVGTNPRTNSKTSLTVAIIPIKMVYGASNGNMTFDPKAPYFGDYSTIDMITNSPLFLREFDYNQGGIDLGQVQYLDAYQRGNFFIKTQHFISYHTELAPAALVPEQTFTVPANEGSVISNPWSGIPTGTADINWFDNQLQTVMQKFSQIQPNILPLFITDNVYLTEGGCCIGGYHSALSGAPGGQSYSYSTVISQAAVPVFSQDIGALSHELGEWLMDPFTQNPSPCPSNGILEIGDPLETETGVHDFGDWPYTIQGFTFHPQDLVFLSWFGAPSSYAVNGWLTFQGSPTLAVCQTAH